MLTFAKKNIKMKRRTGFYAVMFLIMGTVLGTISCSKNTIQPVGTIEFSIGEDIVLIYGQSQQVNLPSSLFADGNLSLSLDFSETPEVDLGPSVTLRGQLAKAVTIDQKTRTLTLNTALLYPNDEVSTTNGKAIPAQYIISLIAKSPDGTILGKDAIALHVSQGKIAVKEAQNSEGTLFAYALYNDTGARFELDVLDIPNENTSWGLKANEANQGIVSVKDGYIKFAASAGDPDQKAEFSYDLEPVLLKDGIAVASTKFKVNFIPQIKFLFGAYYPDLGFTIDLSLLHIGLGNGYVSSAPTLFPEEYKSSFSLVSVSKDGAPFDNTNGVFRVNAETGVVSVKNDDVLVAASYKILVKAETTTGHELETALTLVMSEG